MVADACDLVYMALSASQFLASNVIIMGINDRPVCLHFRSPDALPETRSSTLERQGLNCMEGVIRTLFLI